MSRRNRSPRDRRQAVAGGASRRRSRLGPAAVVAAILLPLLAPAAVQAGIRWVVTGRGYGHGVGLSQWGAYGYARHGRSYRFILRHYYSGTRIGELAGTRLVRVLLRTSAGDVPFSHATAACGRALNAGLQYAAHRVGDGVVLRNSRGRTVADCGRRLHATGAGAVTIAGLGAYHGALEAVPTGSRALNVVNAVAVEQYLKGVVPNEVPASWPMAALRAQAVAARSYAITSHVSGNGFDLYSTTSSQVYKGIATEDPRSNLAASSTRGEVVMYGGRIAQTFFSACSGGHTESAQYAFYGAAIPYLVGVPDPYDYYCPLHSWSLRFSQAEIDARLRGHLHGSLDGVVVTEHGVTPRIVWARLHGSGGVTTIRGDELAAALGAYSRWMTFTKYVDGQPVGGEPPPSPPPGGGEEGGVAPG